MDELLKKGLGKTGDHMNVPVDVASLVQQPAQVAGLRPAQGDHEGQQMGIVNLVDFIHIRREWTDPTASSTQDAPGSIDIEWIPDGGSGFPGLSVRGLDDEDIYDTPCSSRVSGPLFDGERTLDDSMPRRTYCFLASHLGNPDNCQDIVPLYPPPRAIKRQGKPRLGWNQVSEAKAITVRWRLHRAAFSPASTNPRSR